VGDLDGRRSFRMANWDYLTWNLQAWLAAQVADADAEAGIGSGQASSGPQIADIDVRLHDPEAAQLALKTTTEDPNDVAGAALAHHVRARLAWEAGDMATAVAEAEAFGAAYPTPSVAANEPGYQCWIAPIEEAGSHPDRADALLKSVIRYVDCYRFRADILDGRGDWPGAQKAYADAVDLAPDLPAAYYSWGIALARHGDLAGGEMKLKEANGRGPHWADPLKAWARRSVEARQAARSAREVRRGAQVRTELERTQAGARASGEAEELIWLPRKPVVSGSIGS